MHGIGMHLRASRRCQGIRRGKNDDGEVLKGDGRALGGDGEALKDDRSIEAGHEIRIVGLVVTFPGCLQDFLVVRMLRHNKTIFIFQNKLVLN